ncbi:hypothetical protein TCAL_06442 [Tigriopus californicus]|uniref:Uncharacterized protein n=1 Tax=Tigriopus californicus TaxID=6832 RepID=A0A553NP77_TIGCA|nr:hypothetical protein TCAL_06442 [Tigriopus californicus]
MAKDDPQGCCQHVTAGSSTTQTLFEMEFERGIWMAAIENNLPKLNEMIVKDKSCVNARDSSDYTALHYAARAGFLEIMTALLDNGANPNAQTASGKVTPLHRAAYMGHIEAIKLLTRYEADPNLRDSDGKNALHKSCERNTKNAVECFHYLADNYPELRNAKDCKGNLPFLK